MLDKNVLVRDTIRMFLSEVQKFEIDSKEEANDAKALQIINKMIKQRNDSIEQFKKGGRDDLVAKELSEVDVLNKYKPAQLSEDEIVLKVREAISSSEASPILSILYNQVLSINLSALINEVLSPSATILPYILRGVLPDDALWSSAT